MKILRRLSVPLFLLAVGAVFLYAYLAKPFESDGTFCVLDWAHATHGNAGADAAITYMRFSLENPELADKYLKMYCKKADMAIQYIQRWMPVVAAAQLAKGNKDEEKLLREWISVAEYQ